MAAVVVCLLTTPALVQQVGSLGVVSGSVYNGATGSTISGATVTLGPHYERGSTRRAVADEKGRFEIRSVLPGRYSVMAEATRFVADSDFGSQRYVDVAPGEAVRGLRLPLVSAAVLTGVVTDDQNDPVPGVGVAALEHTAIAGRMQVGMMVRGRTDDRGAYRLSGLRPGRYLVAIPHKVLTSGTRPTGLPTIFYPGVSSSVAASAVVVEPGQEHGGINIRIPEPKGLHTLAGTMLGSPAGLKYAVRLIPSESGDAPIELEVREAVTTPAGAFSFPETPPGHYLVRAVAFPTSGRPEGARGPTVTLPSVLGPTPPEPTFWGETSLTVDERGAPSIGVQAREGVRISGRLVFEGSTTVPSLIEEPRMFVVVTPTDKQDIGYVPVARVEADGRFKTAGLPPGQYELFPWIVSTKWRQWTLKSVGVGSREVGGGAVEVDTSPLPEVVIVLTDRPTELSGLVLGSDGKPEAGVNVYAFASDPRLRRLLTWSPSRFVITRTDDSGAFAVKGLLPGDYLLAAVRAGSSVGWASEESLRKLALQATKVALSPGDRRVVNLKGIK